jgi:hypothetical protein
VAGAPRGRVVVADHMDLDAGPKVRAGDYGDGELGEMVSQDMDADRRGVARARRGPDHRGVLADAGRGPGRRVIAFNAAGVKAEIVTGTTPYAERLGIYGRLAAGVTRMLHSVGVHPRVGLPAAVVHPDGPPDEDAAPVRADHRPGLRPCPAVGKTDCLVLDVVGVAGAAWRR